MTLHKHPTRKAIRECAEAMAKHLQQGWSKESLDGLEQLWWQCHKPNGQLMSPNEYKTAQTELTK